MHKISGVGFHRGRVPSVVGFHRGLGSIGVGFHHGLGSLGVGFHRGLGSIGSWVPSGVGFRTYFSLFATADMYFFSLCLRAFPHHLDPSKKSHQCCGFNIDIHRYPSFIEVNRAMYVDVCLGINLIHNNNKNFDVLIY